MTEGLTWPPSKGDLERLYLKEHLSAMKIAEAYGLRYANPKTAESTVLYQLRRNGIKRRDAAEHVRKVTDEMVDDWVRRYNGGESLKKIAGESVSPVTVWNHLKQRGIVLRDKVEAQIAVMTKHEKRRFDGDGPERAYLMGLRYGDLDVVRNGRAIRVRLSTTHPAMAELFDNLFSKFGFVHRYPRKNKLVGYEWTLECDLDSSFDFLLPKLSSEELKSLPRAEMIMFLAGLFDAEGTVYLHNKRGRQNPEVSFANTHEPLLEYVSASVSGLGLYAKSEWGEQKTMRDGVTSAGRLGRVRLWRFGEVQDFLRTLPIRHPEKVAKSELVLEMRFRVSQTEQLETLRKWDRLRKRIKRERDNFVESARLALESEAVEEGQKLVLTEDSSD